MGIKTNLIERGGEKVMYMKLREKKAFTLVELMIVVAIIGLLVAIAVPNFIKARNTARKNVCLNNMRVIHHAAEQYMIDNNVTTCPTTVASFCGATNYIKTEPICPAGTAVYTITSAGVVSCPNVAANPDHVLAGQ